MSAASIVLLALMAAGLIIKLVLKRSRRRLDRVSGLARRRWGSR